jgi:hypothetical protein
LARVVTGVIARPSGTQCPAARNSGPRCSLHHKRVSRPNCELPQRGGRLANDSSDNKHCAFALRVAARCAYTCIKSHEQEATNKFQAFAVGALAKFFNDRGIEVNKPTLQVNVSLTIAAGDDAPYAAFTGTGSNATGLSGTIAGTAAGKDGTKFNVILNSCLRFVIALYVIQKRDHHSMSTLVGDNERHDPPWRRLWPHV